eukprot:TRINITY_DN100_c0_g1_i1.p1 TRINITY_DN100_c0_g1~~TRINITY_DN100_c0_g1_i1.p1  ORF type:complete len:274 (-),score=108.38 TRINITY_DN100_c0_g1_i1:109-930(-)
MASAIDKQGWLEKQGVGLLAGWKRRFFVLKGSEGGRVFLKYYEDDKKAKLKGEIDLENSTCEMAPSGKYGSSKQFCFLLTSPSMKRTFILNADNATAQQAWMDTLRSAMLRIRREKQKKQDSESASSSTSSSSSSSSSASSSVVFVSLTDSLTTSSSSPSTSSSSSSSSFSSSSSSSTTASIPASISLGPMGTSSDTSSSGTSSSISDPDGKYSVYLQWLHETSSTRSRISTAKDNTFHAQLLDESDSKSRCCNCWLIHCSCCPQCCLSCSIA